MKFPFLLGLMSPARCEPTQVPKQQREAEAPPNRTNPSSDTDNMKNNQKTATEIINKKNEGVYFWLGKWERLLCFRVSSFLSKFCCVFFCKNCCLSSPPLCHSFTLLMQQDENWENMTGVVERCHLVPFGWTPLLFCTAVLTSGANLDNKLWSVRVNLTIAAVYSTETAADILSAKLAFAEFAA